MILFFIVLLYVWRRRFFSASRECTLHSPFSFRKFTAWFYARVGWLLLSLNARYLGL